MCLPGMPDRKITVSIGVSRIEDAGSLEEAIGQADQALYQAKNNGRNQVRVYRAQISNTVLTVVPGLSTAHGM